jgi:hypothetical protein
LRLVAAQQADIVSPKIREKKEQKLDFDHFGIIPIGYWWTTNSSSKLKK